MDGTWFASKAEAYRYGELRLLECAGQITGLILQPRYSLTVNGHKIGEYRGDFEYDEYHAAMDGISNTWRKVCEDVKGVETELFKWKWRHAQAEYLAVEFRKIKKGKR